jgi:DNA-binding NtrC family response regulator
VKSGRRRVLVVDDHVDLAENIAEILEGAGFGTAVADSAEAALQRFEAGDIAALITDFRLPGRSGAELIAELRRRGSDVPAVVMSAYTDDDTIATSRRAGALQVLSKPVEIDGLLSLVNTLAQGQDLVLIVDDNRSLAENFAEALRAHQFQTIVCTSAAEALTHRTGVRLAIVDYRLPDATGVQVAEQLQARDPRLRFLFVSAHGDALRADLAGRLAGSSTMEKPVDVAALLSWVTAVFHDEQANRPGR